jgi:hypothetical protein
MAPLSCGVHRRWRPARRGALGETTIVLLALPRSAPELNRPANTGKYRRGNCSAATSGGQLPGDPRRLLERPGCPNGQIRGHRLHWNQRLGRGQNFAAVAMKPKNGSTERSRQRRTRYLLRPLRRAGALGIRRPARRCHRLWSAGASRRCPVLPMRVQSGTLSLETGSSGGCRFNKGGRK